MAQPVTYQNFINGEFVPATATLDVTNPATGAVLGKVPAATAAETDQAIAAARAAQGPWSKLTNSARAKYLTQLAQKVRENADRLATTLVEEQGKVRALAEVEVNFTADYLDYMAGFALRIEGEVLPSERPGELIMLDYQPVGVVAGILPWNFPFFLIARKMAPALLTGNTIVVKPSVETPLNAFIFAELVAQTDLPAGVFNLVGGRGSVVGQRLVENPEVDLISMTGSAPAGRAIMATAGARLGRVNLELGGKAPAIVLADADLDLAAKAIWDSRVINTGQVCNCAEVVLVQEEVHDELVAKLAQLFAGTKYGDPSVTTDLDMGPLINAEAVTRIEQMVAQAVQDGCEIVVGGGRDTSLPDGNFFQPTLLTGATAQMAIAREEIFGPVLPVVKVKDLDEAIAIANASEYGLTSSIFTNNVNSAVKAARELQYGETYINREHFEAMQGFHAGRRQSGIGGADGKHGLMEYVETHITYLQTH